MSDNNNNNNNRNHRNHGGDGNSEGGRRQNGNGQHRGRGGKGKGRGGGGRGRNNSRGGGGRGRGRNSSRGRRGGRGGRGGMRKNRSNDNRSNNDNTTMAGHNNNNYNNDQEVTLLLPVAPQSNLNNDMATKANAGNQRRNKNKSKRNNNNNQRKTDRKKNGNNTNNNNNNGNTVDKNNNNFDDNNNNNNNNKNIDNNNNNNNNNNSNRGDTGNKNNNNRDNYNNRRKYDNNNNTRRNSGRPNGRKRFSNRRLRKNSNDDNNDNNNINNNNSNNNINGITNALSNISIPIEDGVDSNDVRAKNGRSNKPKMILKRGSKVPVELKRSKNPNQSNSNNTKEKKNKKNKKKKKKNGDNDTNNANGNDDANTTGDNAKSEGNTTNEKGGGKKNTKNSKNSKNSKTPKKKKKKKELTEEEKQQLAVQRAELVKKNRASQLSKEIRSLSLALEDSVLGRITEIIEMCFNENMTPEVSSLEAALLFCAKSGQLRDALIIFEIMDRDNVWVQVKSAANILGCVTQKSSPIDGIQFVEDLCHFVRFDSDRAKAYYQRHAAMNLSEFLADAQNSFEKVMRGDQRFLINSGRTELNLALSKGRKQNEYILVDADKNKREIPPGAIDFGNGFDNFGFQRSDTALLSLDNAPQRIVETIPIPKHLQDDPDMKPKYVPHIHGVEVEILNNYPHLSVRFVGLPPLGMSEDFGDLRWRLDKLGNRNSYQRQLDALKILVSTKHDLRNGKDNENITNMKKNLNSKAPHSCIRAALLTPVKQQLKKGDNPSEIKLPRLPSEKILIEKLKNDIGDHLNRSQMGALTHALTRRLTLVQGPPGTGKTHSAIEILTQMVRNRLCPFPILATSDSNIAVDNLLEGLANRGVRALRVGRPESIRDDLIEHSLDVQVKQYNKLYNKSGPVAANAVLKRAEVICATAIGSGSDMMDKFRFHTVLVDESTQATETAILVPIAQGCERLILVGDHCQLPPTVLSEEAEKAGLAVSMFSRFVSQGVHPVLLDTQYRMHPVIAEFPSDSFYAGKLKTGIEYRARLPPAGFDWPVQGAPVAFVPVNEAEEVKDGHSYVNVKEVEKIVVVLLTLIRTGGLENGVHDVGIITPYSSQVRLIRRTLKERKVLRDAGLHLCEVSSVDGFQGREKEVIIFSSVRANFEKNVGFLADWRRMNVMMTRAKRGLIVIGNPSTLHSDRVWHHWLVWAAANGVIQGVNTKASYKPTYLGNTLMGRSSASDSVLAAGAALYASDLTDKEKEETINQAHKIQDEVERGGDGAWDSGPDSPVHKPMKQYESDDDDGENDWENMLDETPPSSPLSKPSGKKNIDGL